MKAYIKDIAAWLPKNIEENPDGRLKKKTGINHRHICSEEMTAGDMAVEAAEILISRGTDRNRIDYILLCTQSPDYFLPTTACLLQDRLGLSRNCGALDFNLGCSGYIYGLGLAKGLIESEQARNVLLLTSETYSRYINKNDLSTRPLFGDAATATLISAAAPITNGEGGGISSGITALVYGTDGSGAQQLIVPAGASRYPAHKTAVEEYHDVHDNRRTNYDLYMEGSAIVNFALEVVPSALEKILERAGLTRSQIDCYIFHQANRFMLNHLQHKCRLENLPYWNDVAEYGNTVSSSIPLAIADMLKQNDSTKMNNVLLMGFGVGLSWGGCIVDLSRVAHLYNIQFGEK